MKNGLKKYTAATTLIITLLLSGNVSAQYYQYDKNIRMGLVFNPNISWLNYDHEHYSGESKFGYAYGLIADFGFARNYYFSTGLLINAINGGMNHDLTPTDPNDPSIAQNRDIHLKYAEVPLTIKLKSDTQDFGRFYGQFGFTAGVRVSGREKIVNATSKRTMDNADLFRLGLQIGTGVEWNLGGNLGLLTGLSYNNGFTRVINESGSPKSSFVALQVGLLF